MSPLGGLGMYVGQSATSPTPGVLTVDRTIHVDSATGNDANDGSATLPFATLARAWTERLTYGELRAKLIVQLHGVGPYTMPFMETSVCGGGGYFVVRGDETTDTIAVSSTFTGDMSGFTLPATAGLGSDTYKGKFIWITSGTCAGARATILSHTDTVITLSLADFRTAASGAIVNGDTFQIRTPGTVINAPTTVSGMPSPGCYEWTGGTTQGNNPPLQHLFVNVAFTGSIVKFQNSSIGLLGVSSTAAALQAFCCKLRVGGVPNANFLGIGANSAANLLYGYGLSVTSGSLTIATGSQALLSGYYTTATTLIGSTSIGDECVWSGGRLDGIVQVDGGRMETQGSYNTQISKTLTVTTVGQLLLNAGTWTFAVTSGQCLFARRNSCIVLTTGATLSGGTTDAASYAMNAVSGSKVILVNRAPALTGVAGADIKAESTAAIANATLGSNGTSTLDAVTQAIVMRVAA